MDAADLAILEGLFAKYEKKGALDMHTKIDVMLRLLSAEAMAVEQSEDQTLLELKEKYQATPEVVAEFEALMKMVDQRHTEIVMKRIEAMKALKESLG
jgi:BioD-like phosphotransacetylase family protein